MLLEKINHFPVMLDQIISIITPQHGGTFIDCTFGAGGYSKEILKYKNPTGVPCLSQPLTSFRDMSLPLPKLKIQKKFQRYFGK